MNTRDLLRAVLESSMADRAARQAALALLLATKDQDAPDQDAESASNNADLDRCRADLSTVCKQRDELIAKLHALRTSTVFKVDAGTELRAKRAEEQLGWIEKLPPSKQGRKRVAAWSNREYLPTAPGWCQIKSGRQVRDAYWNGVEFIFPNSRRLAHGESWAPIRFKP